MLAPVTVQMIGGLVVVTFAIARQVRAQVSMMFSMGHEGDIALCYLHIARRWISHR